MAKPTSKRSATTVYLDEKIARAIRVKGALSGRTVSDLVNEGLRRILSEDERDLRLIKKRARQKTRSYEDVLEDMRRDGLL